jgi:Spy/CpxP family protein refolding chaperone
MRTGLTARFGFVIVSALLASSALAQGPGGGVSGGGRGPGFGEHRPPFEKAMGPEGDHGRWWNNPKVVDALKLTDAQRKEFDATLLAHREKLVDLHANLQKAELEMEPLMGDDQPNEGKILAEIDKVASARAELEKANARFLLAIRAKLSPDQWKALKQLQADRQKHEQERGQWQGREGRPGAGWQGHDGQEPGGQGHDGQGPQGQHHRMPPPPPGAAPAPGPQSMLDPVWDGPAAPPAAVPAAGIQQ